VPRPWLVVDKPIPHTKRKYFDLVLTDDNLLVSKIAIGPPTREQ